MSKPLTMEERNRLRADLAELRRVLDVLRAEIAELWDQLHLPSPATMRLRAMNAAVD